jgi:3-hydroxyacyl-CoA dehydrogenase
MIEYHVAEGICFLRLAALNRNAISLAMLEAIQAGVARANEDPQVRAIALLGDNQLFSSGADLSLFREIRSDDDALRVSAVFQEAYQQVEDSAKPVIAAMAGTVFGGALELALACHFRVAAHNCRFRMPEVTLGIVPGAGGTQRLPRLIGLPTALAMLVRGETLDADRALDAGLVDVVCDADELVGTVRRVADSSPVPRRASRLDDRFRDPEAVAKAFCEAQRIVEKTPPEIIAPRQILEAVRTGIDAGFAAGLRRERAAFAECLKTPAAQNKLYLFFATRQVSKVPELEAIEPRRVGRTAVVGMGTMGAGIVQAFAQAGLRVVALDQDESALRRGLERIRQSLDKRVSQGRLTPRRRDEQLALVTLTSQWSELAGADLVIEAVYEDPAVKQSVLSRIEPLVAADAVVASNTSAISLDVLASGMQHAERLVGMHFFHPAQHMPLVEIVRREGVSLASVATAMQVARTLGKTPVLVRNCVGFLVDRLFIPYVKEAFELLEDGADPAAIDRAAVAFGFPLGPLALIDMTGLDMLVGKDRPLPAAYPRHGALSPVAIRLVESGQLGQKSGGGVYRYEPGDHTPHPSETTARLVAEVQRESGRVPRAIRDEAIAERLVLRMVNEALYAMEDGIARSAADVDVATVLGLGFPDYRGGVLRYASQAGLDRVLDRLARLADQCGQRFQPSPTLQREQASHGVTDRTERL